MVLYYCSVKVRWQTVKALVNPHVNVNIVFLASACHVVSSLKQILPYTAGKGGAGFGIAAQAKEEAKPDGSGFSFRPGTSTSTGTKGDPTTCTDA